MSLFISPRFKFAHAQEHQEKKTTDIQNNEKSADHVNEESGFFNYEYKIRVQEEANYNEIRSTLLNPNQDFSSDKNYYNRLILDLNTKFFLGKYFDLNFHDQAAWKSQEKEKIDETETKNYLQELFLTARIYDTLIIDIGRENIISGVAFGWNPTDFMLNASISANPDPRALREQRLGAYLVKSSLFFDFGQITALYAPEIRDIDTNKEQRQLYKITTNLFSNTLLEFLYFREKKNSFGSNLEISLMDDLILHFEVSASESSNIFTVNSNETDGYDFSKRDDRLYLKSIIGINYTLPDLHNIIIEFYYNQEGFSKKEWDEFFLMLDYSKTRYNSDAYEISPGINPYYYYFLSANKMFYITRMSRYYLFFRLSKQNIIIDNFNYAVFSYINPYDKSAFINFNPEYSFLNNFTSGIIFSCYAGKEKSEFGLSPNRYAVLWYFGIYF